MAVTIATAANYWINSNALSISLNALGEPNRIQASVANGAVIMCYIRGVKPASAGEAYAKNGDGLEYDNGHNYRRWPLVISPTYFNSNTEKYLYVAIPRTLDVGAEAAVIFPSQLLDIYGYAVVEDPETHEKTQGEQIGNNNYFYIFLQGIITSSGESGYTPREWRILPDMGTLKTDEAIDSTETNWYRWDPVSQTVTFLKEIIMDRTSWFRNLIAKSLTLNGRTLNGVAVKDVTPSDSDDTIVTPAYLDGLTDGKYIRKDQDDRTDFSLGIGGNLTVDGDTTVDGTLFANQSVRTDEVRSSNYTGDTIADTGYLLTAGLTNGLGHSKLTIDEIYVRMKATFESLEVRKWSVVAGDEIRSCAANIINRVDYFTDTGELLGYTEKRVPWLMKRVPFLLKLFGNVQSQWGRYLYSKIVRMRVTLSNADVARIAYCRCYFLADDGDTTIENWWQRDDLVRCQTMNITSTIRNTYTNIQRKAGNVFWWRKCIRVSANGVAPSENPDNVRCQPAIIDEKTYHWFDVVFNGAIEYDPTTGQMTGRTDGNFMANSDLPAAGDHAIQFGNTTIPGRMNLWITMVNGGSTRDYDPDGDAPCIKGFTGIYTFDLNKCFTGGNPCKMTLAPGKKYHFYGREFRVIKEYGEVPMPTQRGAWLELPLELDENNNQLTYPDDIYNDQGAFVSRGGYILVNGVKRYGSAENPIPRTYARKCYWYDEVTHKGGTWLCSITEGSHWVTDVAFTDDATGRSFTAGQIVPPGIYSALSTLSKAKCSSHENYTTDEPSGISASWTNLTKGVTTMETRYRKKARLKYNGTLQKYEVDPDAGIIPPAEPWAQWYTLQQWEAIQRSGTEPSPENQIMQDGDYMWSCTMTEFSSDNPVFEYKVVRWGIDSDGLKINSYFLGLSNTSIIITPSNDNYKMPGDSGWDAAAPQGKWWDTFDAMAAANGGVGAMQGWNVWTKTVIHYDLAENKSPDEQKPDLVQYTCSRIGQDGQIAQEEYYMLAESDDFATVFGNPAQAASYYYAKTGIRWYTEDTPKTTDLPEAERYRLSSNTPNICTKASEQTTAATPIWSPTRPSYDNSTAAKAAKKFLWNFEYRVDGQGTPYATKPICIGDHSRGIVGVRELYALSQYGHAADGQDYPSDVRSGSAQEQQTDKRVWTDEIYDRAPTEQLPYQWNWTRTLYTNPLNASDTARDAATGYPYEDHYHVSSVRGTKGEDGAGTEYVYCRPQSHDANGNPLTVTLPDPNILKDAGGTARTRDYIKQTDDFIPYQYTDNPVGIDFQHQVEYQCERKSTAVSGTGGFSGGHEWGLFSQPKPWSKWGKNGMDGDGTEYVFIRTKSNVAPVLLSNDGGTASQYQSNEWRPYVDGTGRTDIETNDGSTAKPRCSDDPKGCTRDWPYEWIAKRTMATPDAESGKRVWKSYYASVGSPYKMSPWSNYAENAMRLDLDNENDSMLYTGGGTLVSGNVTSTAYFFDGSEDKSAQTTFSIIDRVGVTSSQATISGRVITVTGMNATTAKITVQGVYTDGHNQTHTKTTVLTLKKIVDGDKYALVVRPNAIAYNVTTDTPAASTIAIEVWKTSCDGVRALSAPPSGYGVYANGTALTASSTGMYSYTTDNSEIGEVAVRIAKGASSNDCLDYETVPVNKAENGTDGKPGTDALTIDTDNDSDAFGTDSDSKIVEQQVRTTFVKMYSGTTPQTLTNLTATLYDNTGAAVSSGIAKVSTSLSTGEVSVTFYSGATVYANSIYALITATCAKGSLSTKFTMQKVKSGAPGVSPDIFQLKPSPTSLSFGRDASGSLTPASKSVSISIVKTKGSTQTEYTTAAAAGVTVRYSTSSMPSSASAGTGWSSGAISVVNSAESLYVAMFNSSGVLLDRETIPVLKEGQKGADGKDGWMVIASPANVLLTQSLDTPSSFSSAVVGFTAKKGSRDVAVNSISNPSSDEFNVAKNGSSGDAAKQVKVSSPKTTGGSYYTSGSFNVTVYVTDPDTGEAVTFSDIRVLCYANLLGTWKQSVEDGTETSIAKKLSYEIFDDQVHTIDQTGEYIRGWGENTSKLQKTVGRNMLDCADGAGWRYFGSNEPADYNASNQRVLPESSQSTVDAFTSSVWLESGTIYTFSVYTPSYPSFRWRKVNSPEQAGKEGTQYSVTVVSAGSGRYFCTFTPSASGYYKMNVWDVSYVEKAQLEVGSVPTAWESTKSYSSEIKQTAEEIKLSVKDDLGETGIDITNHKIEMQADDFVLKNSGGSQVVGVNARGDFEVAGTIKATNFYHHVCYYFGGGVCLNGGEKYYKGGLQYDTSGYADIIEIQQPYNGNWSWTGDSKNKYTILLPDPSTCEGKIVTVYCGVVYCTGSIAIGCIGTNKMVTRWSVSNGVLVPESVSGDQPIDALNLEAGRYIEGYRLSNGWSGSRTVDVDLFEPVVYAFAAQKSGDDYYWFQVK